MAAEAFMTTATAIAVARPQTAGRRFPGRIGLPVIATSTPIRPMPPR
jgi:hypothetical protein